MIQKRTIGIIGTGNVGTAAAYALFNQRLANEIILIDKDKKLAEGEAMDLMHGQLLVGNVNVKSGNYKDLANAQVIVISAGASQPSSVDDRLSLLDKNIGIFRDIIPRIDKYAPEAIIVIATNPVDILTYATKEISNRPATKVLGTGTLLDTARFRSLLGKFYDVDPQSVHAYILGEHGDSEVPIWSGAAIGGKPIMDNTIMGKRFDREIMEDIFERTKEAAYNIIDRKGHTDTAIGVVIAQIVEDILADEKKVLPLSVHANGSYGIEDVCLSLPSSVGLNGIAGHILPEISEDEKQALRHSASILKEEIDKLDGLH